MRTLTMYLSDMSVGSFRDAATTRDVSVRAAVARLAKMAAVSEMKLEGLQLQAEGNRIGQLGISTGGIMGMT